MAVLVEGISVVVRRAAIDEKYLGGWDAFVAMVPSLLFAADDDIAVVGFQGADEAEAYCESLAESGISFGDDGEEHEHGEDCEHGEECQHGEQQPEADVAIVDQFQGVLTETSWLECARFDFDDAGHEIAVCWLYAGPHAHGEIELPGEELDVAVPDGWTYEDSLSAGALFIPEDEVAERLEFLRHENGVDVFRDRTTGEQLYSQGKTEQPEPEKPKTDD